MFIHYTSQNAERPLRPPGRGLRRTLSAEQPWRSFSRGRCASAHQRHRGARRLRLPSSQVSGLLQVAEVTQIYEGTLSIREAGHRQRLLAGVAEVAWRPESAGRRGRLETRESSGPRRANLSRLHRSCPRSALRHPGAAFVRRRTWRAGCRTSWATRQVPVHAGRLVDVAGHLLDDADVRAAGSASPGSPTPASSPRASRPLDRLGACPVRGYDADHPRARGEVGREGVSVARA